MEDYSGALAGAGMREAEKQHNIQEFIARGVPEHIAPALVDFQIATSAYNVYHPQHASIPLNNQTTIDDIRQRSTFRAIRFTPSIETVATLFSALGEEQVGKLGELVRVVNYNINSRTQKVGLYPGIVDDEVYWVTQQVLFLNIGARHDELPALIYLLQRTQNRVKAGGDTDDEFIEHAAPAIVYDYFQAIGRDTTKLVNFADILQKFLARREVNEIGFVDKSIKLEAISQKEIQTFKGLGINEKDIPALTQFQKIQAYFFPMDDKMFIDIPKAAVVKKIYELSLDENGSLDLEDLRNFGLYANEICEHFIKSGMHAGPGLADTAFNVLVNLIYDYDNKVYAHINEGSEESDFPTFQEYIEAFLNNPLEYLKEKRILSEKKEARTVSC
jgi:hypothetical protein